MNLKKVSGWYRIGFYVLLVPLLLKFLYDLICGMIIIYILTYNAGAL